MIKPKMGKIENSPELKTLPDKREIKEVSRLSYHTDDIEDEMIIELANDFDEGVKLLALIVKLSKGG